MKKCPNCGSVVNECIKYCGICGSKLNYVNSISSVYDTKVSQKSVITCIILSFFTFGLYNLYWFYCITNDVNKIDDENNLADGLVALVYLFLSFGIYNLYWNYKV